MREREWIDARILKTQQCASGRACCATDELRCAKLIGEFVVIAGNRCVADRSEVEIISNKRSVDHGAVERTYGDVEGDDRVIVGIALRCAESGRHEEGEGIEVGKVEPPAPIHDHVAERHAQPRRWVECNTMRCNELAGYCLAKRIGTIGSGVRHGKAEALVGYVDE